MRKLRTGDRVTINLPGHPMHGRLGRILTIRGSEHYQVYVYRNKASYPFTAKSLQLIKPEKLPRLIYFEHKHFINAHEYADRKPQICKITKVTKTAIYYRPVYRRYGATARKERLGMLFYSKPETFEQDCVLNWLEKGER